MTAAGEKHYHDSFRCPEHADNCSCPDLDEYLCNPYWVSGHCPDGLLVMPEEYEIPPEHAEMRRRFIRPPAQAEERH